MGEHFVFIDPAGVEHALSDRPDVRVLRGVRGRGMPPFDYREDDVPGQHGARVREIKAGPREVDIPILVAQNSDVLLRDKLRTLLPAMDPTRGEGKLRCTASDGSQREFACQYRGGLELNERAAEGGASWQKAIIVFRGGDPFWYDAASRVVTFEIDEVSGVFFPVLPLVLSSSSVFADANVDNDGDYEASPFWTVTGPGSDLALRNLTTGKVLQLSTVLDPGESLTIDTRPGRRTITHSDGSNLYPDLVAGYSLWPLARGNNAIRLELAGATVASSIELTYVRRFWVA